jgi:hypothetical protein
VLDREAHARALRMIDALRRAYRDRTRPDNEFVVVLFSDHGADGAWLREALEELRLPYLDYSRIEWSRVTGEPAVIELDGHPTPATYHALAASLVEDLALGATRRASLESTPHGVAP